MFAGKNILLVEDEALIAMLLEDIVVALGCTVVAVESQLERAMERAGTDALDAAILDVNLGGRRSYGVADILHRRGIPFVFATGYGESGVGSAHRDAPVLMKPYTEDDVAEALAKLLGVAPEPIDGG